LLGRASKLSLTSHENCFQFAAKHARDDTSIKNHSDAADLLIYQSSNWQAVEAVCECLPKAYVVPPFALVIEAVNPIDGRTLMVTSQQKEVLWILDLHSLDQDH